MIFPEEAEICIPELGVSSMSSTLDCLEIYDEKDLEQNKDMYSSLGLDGTFRCKLTTSTESCGFYQTCDAWSLLKRRILYSTLLMAGDLSQVDTDCRRKRRYASGAFSSGVSLCGSADGIRCAVLTLDREAITDDVPLRITLITEK